MVAQSTLPAVRAETLEEVDAVDARAPVSAGAADAVVDICIKKKNLKKKGILSGHGETVWVQKQAPTVWLQVILSR